MLEHHRHAGGLAPEQEGLLPERPLLAPWLRKAERAGTTLLEYGDSIVALEGDGLSTLLPRLDGTRRAAELSPAERAAVAALAAEGVVVAGPAVRDEDALAEAAAGPVSPAACEERLREARVAVVGSGLVADELLRLLPGRSWRAAWRAARVDAQLAVVAPSPSELPELPDWNERCLATSLPWLLVLPYNGRFASVGPLVLPGVTSCYACMQQRRAAALPDPDDFVALQAVPAAYPTGRPLAALLAGMAALAARRWLAQREATLAGAFLAVALEGGVSVDRHRVLRVPRCRACSPAEAHPPVLAWASSEHR